MRAGVSICSALIAVFATSIGKISTIQYYKTQTEVHVNSLGNWLRVDLLIFDPAGVIESGSAGVAELLL